MMTRHSSRGRPLPTRATRIKKEPDEASSPSPSQAPMRDNEQLVQKPSPDRRREKDSKMASVSSPSTLLSTKQAALPVSRGKDAQRLLRLQEKQQAAVKKEYAEEKKTEEPELVSEEAKKQTLNKDEIAGNEPKESETTVVNTPHETPSVAAPNASSIVPSGLPSIATSIGPPPLPTPLPVLSSTTTNVAVGTEVAAAAASLRDLPGTTPLPFLPPGHASTPACWNGLTNANAQHHAPFHHDWTAGLPYHLTPSNMFAHSFMFHGLLSDGDDSDLSDDESGSTTRDKKPAASRKKQPRVGATVSSDSLDAAAAVHQSSSVHWTPTNHLGAVVLSHPDGTPLALLESDTADISELFRRGAIQVSAIPPANGGRSNSKSRDDSDSKPERKYLRWTDEEDDVLRRAVNEGGHPPINWKRIARKYFKGMRSSVQCKNRWKKVLMPGLRRDPWTEDEDAVIMNGVANDLKWSEIAKLLNGRIAEQIRDRWMNQLDPTLKKEPWTEQEVDILFRLQAEMGNKWSDIAQYLPGRSENAVKNRWHNAKVAQRRKMKKLAKEAEMAERLKEARNADGLTEEEEAEMIKGEALKAIHALQSANV